MASSSSSFQSIKHHVFLSFRGTDTRHSFVSHLYGYLHDRLGIPTFIDNRLERGEEIEPAILKAIQESYISVIIFSKNFASSPYCLDEVVKILECKDKFNQKVIPVFYHVDPDDVSNQTGSFSEDFPKLDQDFKDNAQRLQSWRIALSRAASIAGEVLIESRSDEYASLQDIVKSILNYLRKLYTNKVQNLVSLQSQIERMQSLLSIASDDVRIVGIWGMAGIGKTTLARVVFENLSSHFDCKCFIDNVREKSLQTSGQAKLEEEFLSKIHGEKNIHPNHGMLMNMLCYKKILLVLDDVEDFETINFAEHSCFGAGSRIIITSRDKGLLEGRVDNIYEVEALNEHGALQLFSMHAFKQSGPETNYVELSKTVVRYARGIPLVVKVLGSYLYNKSKQQWESAMEKLENSLNQEVGKIFRISYDGLDFEEQQVFHHIACFLKGESQWQIQRVLDACGFSTLIDLRILENKSLINISGNKVLMHDLLQQMGHEIVRDESKEPGKRSRLHNPEDVIHVLTKNMGTESVEGIFFDQSKTSTLSLDRRVFCNMIGMKMLKLYDSTLNIYHDFFNNCRDDLFPLYLNFPQGLEFLSTELRYLHWHFYPLKALPSSFHFEKLVVLNMACSKVERLWTGVQILPNLKEIWMDGCRFLIEMPNLSGAPNLEIISFCFCKRLIWVSPSIQCLDKLHKLDLTFCEKIKTLPSFVNISSLKSLSIYGCLKINKFPEVPATIEKLLLGGTAIEDIPSSFGLCSQLQTLDLHGCPKLRNLPKVIFQLKHVRALSISLPYVCTTALLNDLCGLRWIRRLTLLRSSFKSLPSSIKLLSWLEFLDLSCCESLQSLPELPVNLEQLEASHCTSLETISNSVLEISSGQKHLDFAGCASLDHKNLLIHLLQKMQQLAFKTVESCRGGEMKHSIIIPGDNIPNWIRHQNTGYSITLSLPPKWYENFMGFALSAVLLIGENTEYGSYFRNFRIIRIECRFQSSGGESYFLTSGFCFDEWSSARKSLFQNLLLFYDRNLCLEVRNRGKIMDHYDEVSIEFFMEDKFHNPLPSRIRKCGVRLLYEGDDYFMQEPNNEISFQEDSRGQHEVESIVVKTKKRRRRNMKYLKFFSLNSRRQMTMNYFALSKRKQVEHLAVKNRKKRRTK